jgi:hypothetical protein
MYNPKGYCRVYESPPLVPVASQINGAHVFPFCFCASILILSSHLRLRLLRSLFPLDFPTKTCMSFFSLPCLLHAPYFLSSLNWPPSWYLWERRVVWLFVTQFWGPKYLSQFPPSRSPLAFSFLNVKDDARQNYIFVSTFQMWCQFSSPTSSTKPVLSPTPGVTFQCASTVCVCVRACVGALTDKRMHWSMYDVKSYTRPNWQLWLTCSW